MAEDTRGRRATARHGEQAEREEKAKAAPIREVAMDTQHPRQLRTGGWRCAVCLDTAPRQGPKLRAFLTAPCTKPSQAFIHRRCAKAQADAVLAAAALAVVALAGADQNTSISRRYYTRCPA